MNQSVLIICCALAMGIVGAWGTWLMIDVGAVLGTWWTARKERRRLEKEAKAVKEAEQDGEEG